MATQEKVFSSFNFSSAYTPTIFASPKPYLNLCSFRWLNWILRWVRSLAPTVSKVSSLTLFRMGLFGTAHGWGRGGKKPYPLKSVAYILQRSNLEVIPYLRRPQKIWERFMVYKKYYLFDELNDIIKNCS